MIIKNAERFGLSQLHQLRGRVGRSDIQSYCFLESTKKDSDRLKAMEETSDGFKLAEIDMKLRGAGEIMGFRQSGQSDIPLEILSDINFVQKVQEAAAELISLYPTLDELPGLREEINLVGGQLLV
jgi:ATP-dependent DNA helicase RecG